MITRNSISSSVCLRLIEKSQITRIFEVQLPAIYRLGPIVCMNGQLPAALAAYCQ